MMEKKYFREEDLLHEFIELNIVVTYRDCNEFKVSVGELIEVDEYFLKLEAENGALVLNKKAISKIVRR